MLARPTRPSAIATADRGSGGARKKPAARHREARFVAGAATIERIPPATLPEIAVAGRSNVGKSSLLNRLVRRHGLARVGKTPGRTQQINFFAIGDRLTLVDLPGYGFARVPLAVKEAWRRLVEHYLTRRAELRGVVVLVDARRGIGDEDARLLEFLAAHGVAAQLVATKIDRLKRSERAALLRSLEPDTLLFSATSGEGVDELWEAIEKMLRRDLAGAPGVR
jgi:GTP-binding protein